MADALPPLLLPATAALLDGWCGPAVSRAGQPVAMLDHRVHDPIEPGPDLWWCCGMHSGRTGTDTADGYHLDLARPECFDRVVRVLTDLGHDVDTLFPDLFDAMAEQGLTLDWRSIRPAHLLAVAREVLRG